ncbi:MAG: SMC-Scp complex subunit ScpB, partial [Sphingobium sp.]
MSFEEGPDESLRALEAALFASTEPMTLAQMRQLLGNLADLPELLARLSEDYAGRGVNLVERGGR